MYVVLSLENSLLARNSACESKEVVTQHLSYGEHCYYRQKYCDCWNGKIEQSCCKGAFLTIVQWITGAGFPLELDLEGKCEQNAAQTSGGAGFVCL